MPSTLTPLRYPGGKSQLRPFVRELIEYADRDYSVYCEPYCGGAGIAIDLLLKNVVKEIHINDADIGIYSFWMSVINDPELLIRFIQSARVDVETWQSAREEYRRIRDSANIQSSPNTYLGFLTLYLNRTNISGIIDGGCIGGKNQLGSSKIDSRFNKETLVRKISQIAEYSPNIHVTGLDGVDFLQSVTSRFSSEIDSWLVYLDPPYVAQGGNLYLNAMSPQDHETLADFVLNSALSNWLLTYDDSPLIQYLYRQSNMRKFEVQYSTNRRRSATEIIVLSDAFSGFDSRSRPLKRFRV